VLAARVTAKPQRDFVASPRENRRTLSFPATLMEFFAPSAYELKRVHFTPVCLTGYGPPSGFLTLSTVCSSLERPALFHASNAHGVLLSRDFPSQPGPTARRCRVTLLAFLLTSATNNHCRCLAPDPCKPLNLQSRPFVAFRALLRLRIRTVGGLLYPEPSDRFPPELCCLSRVLPRLNGHVTRNVFTHALCLLDRPQNTKQARRAKG
jgi:hypothetical protein